MNEPSRHGAWSAGDSYEAYMGRWSRLVAKIFSHGSMPFLQGAIKVQSGIPRC